MKLNHKVISLVLLGLFTTVKASASDSSSWWRGTEDYYTGFADSTDSKYQATIGQSLLQNGKSYVRFGLVLPHSEYCSDKDQKHSEKLNMTVNDRSVAFSLSCFKKKWLNIKPSSLKGNKFVIDEFNHRRNEKVTFIIPVKNSPDWVFNFATKGFGKIYSSIHESVQETIR